MWCHAKWQDISSVGDKNKLEGDEMCIERLREMNSKKQASLLSNTRSCFVHCCNLI